MKRLSIDAALLGHPKSSIQRTMMLVIVALLPGTLIYACIVNTHIAINVLIACVSALIFEASVLKLRKRPVLPTLSDGSIVVAAWLLALCLPPTLPAWQLITGTFIMCTLGKHVFGGLGHNPFNPAMVAYAVLVVSYPASMTQWDTSSRLLETGTSNTSQSADQVHESQTRQAWDSITLATPLDRLRQYRHNVQRAEAEPAANSGSEQALIEPASHIFESDWFMVNLGWIIGGVLLLLTRTISWHIPFAVLGSIFLTYGIYSLWAPAYVMGPVAALLSGAIIFGAFFIATDPVSSATSPAGKIIYGVGIGVCCFFIREFSAYPEGFAFAVLLMNICVPLIDYALTRNSSGYAGKHKLF